MRLSQHFGRTLREAPTDAVTTSHKLILRAGLARPIAAGIWAYLPMGYRVLRRLEQIIREEMDAIGTEEMLMPVMHPAELWQATGRWDSVDVLIKLKNREGRDFALAVTHEEVVVNLCLTEIESYRDLPRAVYHFQTKERDESRAWGGLLRLREFHMHDAYSLDANEAGLAATYERCYQAYLKVFDRCGLDVVAVEADSRTIGGSDAHEFMLPNEEGEDQFVRCESCGYAANIEAAQFERAEALYGDPAEMEKVETPDCHTIAQLCDFLQIDPKQTLKLVMYTSNLNRPGEMVIMALVRGDLDVNEAKLKRALGISDLQPATEDVIAEMGAQAGYASPIGLDVRGEGEPTGIVVVADESLRKMSNFVTGANDAGYHYVNANYPRDFDVTQFADLAEPFEGAACARCGGALRVENAIVLGQCFKLGTRYSEAVGATYLDDKGKAHPIVMGSYGIGLDRLLAAIIEKHHDDYGIIWPREAAPYDVHIVAIAKKEDDEAVGVAEQLYADLQAAGLSVVYDDRRLSPGVMFTDADLIGVPLRITVGARSLEKGGVEVKRREEKERALVPVGEVVETIRGM
jgi:prolyl-tRNA synthetase